MAKKTATAGPAAATAEISAEKLAERMSNGTLTRDRLMDLVIDGSVSKATATAALDIAIAAGEKAAAAKAAKSGGDKPHVATESVFIPKDEPNKRIPGVEFSGPHRPFFLGESKLRAVVAGLETIRAFLAKHE